MNTFLKPKVYANAMLKLLKNNLVMGKLVSTTYKNEFKKIGDKMFVKRPPQFLVREGRVAQVQPVLEGEVEVKLDRQVGVDIEFTSVEETLELDDLLKNEVMQSNAATLAQYVDTALMESVLYFPNWVGTPGEIVDSFIDYSKGPERLDHLAVPEDGNRFGVLGVTDSWALANSFGYHPSAADLAKKAIERARIPMLGGTDAYKTQSVINLITGTRAAAGAAQVDGNNQVVTYDSVKSDYTQTLAVKGLAAGATIKAGEVFSIANVYGINPRTKQRQDFLAQFVVLQDVTADGGGLANIKFQLPIIVGGAYATVNTAPVNNGAITFMGAASSQYRQNAVFHKSAIQLTFAKLVMPRSGRAAYSTDPETGITIRYWETSDGTNDTHLHRWDLLFGVNNVDPRLGTRLSGTASVA
jgi:hypothetical protein